MVVAFSYNIWPHCAPSGTQEDDHEHNWRWQDEAAPGPDSPPEVSNYSNFLWYDNFFMCRQTCIITDVGSFLALSNISSTLVDFWMSGWKLAKLKTDHGDTGKFSGQIKFVFTFLKGSIGSSTENVMGYFYSSKPKIIWLLIVIEFMRFISLNI